MATEIDMDKIPGIELIRSVTQKLACELAVDLSLHKSFVDNSYGNDYILYLYLKKAENKDEMVVTRIHRQVLIKQDASQIKLAILDKLKKTNIRRLMGPMSLTSKL